VSRDQGGMGAPAVIHKFEIYNFHRLDLTQKAPAECT
jgi:hypothetical protein